MRLDEEQRIKDYLLGKRLASLRGMVGVGRPALAGRLGVGEADVAAIEAGTRRLSAMELPGYAHALGLDTAILCAVIDEVERTWREG